MSTPPHIHEIDDFSTQCCTVCGKYLGVAAPLEPSASNCPATPEEFAKSIYNLLSLGGHAKLPNTFVAVLAEQVEAYAAAVSKNLTDKYAEMEAKWMRELLTVSDEIGEARKELDLVKRVLLQHLNDEDFEYSLVGLYTKLTENESGKSPR